MKVATVTLTGLAYLTVNGVAAAPLLHADDALEGTTEAVSSLVRRSPLGSGLANLFKGAGSHTAGSGGGGFMGHEAGGFGGGFTHPAYLQSAHGAAFAHPGFAHPMGMPVPPPAFHPYGHPFYHPPAYHPPEYHPPAAHPEVHPQGTHPQGHAEGTPPKTPEGTKPGEQPPKKGMSNKAKVAIGAVGGVGVLWGGNKMYSAQKDAASQAQQQQAIDSVGAAYGLQGQQVQPEKPSYMMKRSIPFFGGFSHLGGHFHPGGGGDGMLGAGAGSHFAPYGHYPPPHYGGGGYQPYHPAHYGGGGYQPYHPAHYGGGHPSSVHPEGVHPEGGHPGGGHPDGAHPQGQTPPGATPPQPPKKKGGSAKYIIAGAALPMVGYGLYEGGKKKGVMQTSTMYSNTLGSVADMQVAKTGDAAAGGDAPPALKVAQEEQKAAAAAAQASGMDPSAAAAAQ